MLITPCICIGVSLTPSLVHLQTVSVQHCYLAVLNKPFILVKHKQRFSLQATKDPPKYRFRFSFWRGTCSDPVPLFRRTTQTLVRLFIGVLVWSTLSPTVVSACSLQSQPQNIRVILSSWNDVLIRLLFRSFSTWSLCLQLLLVNAPSCQSFSQSTLSSALHTEWKLSLHWMSTPHLIVFFYVHYRRNTLLIHSYLITFSSQALEPFPFSLSFSLSLNVITHLHDQWFQHLATSPLGSLSVFLASEFIWIYLIFSRVTITVVTFSVISFWSSFSRSTLISLSHHRTDGPWEIRAKYFHTT